MNYTVIAEGNDISLLGQAEDMLKEYDYGEVRVYVSSPPSQEALSSVEQQMIADGVTLTGPVVYDPDTGAIVVPFQKRMSPLQYIGVGVGAFVLFGAMIFAWQLTRSVGSGGLAGVWVVIGICGLILFIKSAEGHAVVKAGYQAAQHVGKVYTARRMFLDRPTKQQITAATKSQIAAETTAQSAQYSRATGYEEGGRRYGETGMRDDINESEER